MTVRSRNGYAQHTLHSHSVATVAPIMEETASTLPFAIIVVRGMNIVLALEIGLEASELYTLWFLRIALGFCDFADHT
jgi:hypothetical protein